MHTAYRKLISREFTQGPAHQYQSRIQQLATQIVECRGTAASVLVP